MKCTICGKDIGIFVWNNIPNIDGPCCDRCALAQLKGFIEDNNPENSRVNPQEYEKVKDMLEKIKNEEKN